MPGRAKSRDRRPLAALMPIPGPVRQVPKCCPPEMAMPRVHRRSPEATAGVVAENSVEITRTVLSARLFAAPRVDAGVPAEANRAIGEAAAMPSPWRRRVR